MIGTIFSVKEAILEIPPTKTNNEIAAIIIPTIHGLIPNAVPNASPMELDCTAFPIKPNAKIMSTANVAARILPNFPVNAALM